MKVEPAGDLQTIDRVDHREGVRGSPRLVGLQRSNEVPFDRVGQLRLLVEGLLDLVLAENPEAGLERLVQPLDRLSLAGSDEG